MSCTRYTESLEASIIIPMWNGANDIVSCLESVFRQVGVNFEVIVVDNASQDDSAELVANHFPQVSLIHNDTNLGFSGGVNVGLREAEGTLIVLLNQDTEVHPDWLKALVDATVDQSMGVLGSKAVYPDGSIQHAGGRINAQGLGSHIGQYEPDDGRWDTPLDCDYVTGASMAITREVYERIGGFDEGFRPAYFEDVDYCFRVRRAGYRVVYWPASVLTHKEASVLGARSQEGMIRFNRNRLRFVLKHMHTGLVADFFNAEHEWLDGLHDAGRVRVHLALYRDLLHDLYADTGIARIIPKDTQETCIQGLIRLATQANTPKVGEAISFSQAQKNVERRHAVEKSPRKVLVINPNFPPDGYLGGAEISCYHTTKAIEEHGDHVRVLAVNAREPIEVDERYSYEGIPVHRVTFKTPRRTPNRDLFDRRVYDAVIEEINTFNPDLVHIHNASGVSLAPFKACEDSDVPVVCTLHDLWLLCPNNMLYRRDGSLCDTRTEPTDCDQCFRKLDFWANVPHRRQVFMDMTRNVRYFIAPTQALIDRHVEVGYDPARFIPVRLGFDAGVTQFPIHPRVRRLVSQANRSGPMILFTGGGHEIKGAKVVVRALPMMLKHVKDLHVVVAGGGDDRVLERMRALSPLVTVLGKVPFTDMRALMSLADLVLVPSIVHENSPVTIFEAYQVGTPVVASNYGGIPELVDSHKTGYLFPRGYSEYLAARVIEHFTRPAQVRRQMHKFCLDTVNTVLGLEAHVNGILDVYAKVLT